MQFTSTYKGLEYTVDTVEKGRDQWGWEYTLDGKYFGRSNETASLEITALAAGRMAAVARVDRTVRGIE
jgi:hypothetical protein